MEDSFSLFDYLKYVSSQRRWLVVAVGVAAAGALAISMLLPARYTATARLIIEPPAGSDSRSPQVVTPQYLESLRTFESLATSDSLFERAMERFGLRKESPGRTVEAWKSSALRAALIRNTKVLEIAVTLPDARKAHRMAQFLAEETIALSRDLHRTADREVIGEAETEAAIAQRAFEEADRQLSQILRTETAEALDDEIESLLRRQRQMERRLVEAEIGAAGARVQLLRAELETVKKSLASANARLAAREEQSRPVKERRKAALAHLEAARKRLEDAKGMAGFRGERLRLIDPGIVPERRSSPNIALNVIGAAVFALAASVAYLSLRYGAADVAPRG